MLEAPPVLPSQFHEQSNIPVFWSFCINKSKILSFRVGTIYANPQSCIISINQKGYLWLVIDSLNQFMSGKLKSPAAQKIVALGYCLAVSVIRLHTLLKYSTSALGDLYVQITMT